MGMYVCHDCLEKYSLTAGISGTNHAICEICGPLSNDWSVKFDVHFTHDIDRPIKVENLKQFIEDQLAEHANRHQM